MKCIDLIDHTDSEYTKVANELYAWTYLGIPCFVTKLFRVFSCASYEDMVKFTKMYPYEVAVFRDWDDAETPRDFFIKVGLIAKVC